MLLSRRLSWTVQKPKVYAANCASYGSFFSPPIIWRTTFVATGRPSKLGATVHRRWCTSAIPTSCGKSFLLDADQANTGQNNGVLRAMVGDHSILLLDGEPHQRQRKLLMPPFHGDRLRTYGQLICDLTRQISADWQPGQTMVVRPPLQELTLGVILQAVFGLHEGERLTALQRLMSRMLDTFAYPLSSSFLFFSRSTKGLGSVESLGAFCAPAGAGKAVDLCGNSRSAGRSGSAQR